MRLSVFLMSHFVRSDSMQVRQWLQTKRRRNIPPRKITLGSGGERHGLFALAPAEESISQSHC
jgi:hypothetical protein